MNTSIQALISLIMMAGSIHLSAGLGLEVMCLSLNVYDMYIYHMQHTILTHQSSLDVALPRQPVGLGIWCPTHTAEIHLLNPPWYYRLRCWLCTHPIVAILCFRIQRPQILRVSCSHMPL